MEEDELPEVLPIAMECIPEELTERSQWVCWNYQQRDGKPAKIPINPDNGAPASTNDSSTWGTFGAALLHWGSDGAAGIGFVFSAADPYTGIDIDGCIDEDGNPSEAASEIVSTLDSYTEESPSGTGLHVIVEGTLPDGDNRSENVEIYDGGRFFTVTGSHVPETPLSIEHRQEELTQVHADYVQSPPDTEIITGGGDSPSPVPLSDDRLIEKAKSAKKGEEFTRLWDGQTTGYESHSEADAALCSRLTFWTAGDQKRINRLFRRSGLMRSKWDEQCGDQTYGERTIDAALQMTDNYYEPDFGTEPTDEQTEARTTIEDVERVVLSEFDGEMWETVESILSAHSTHLLRDQSGGTGLVVTGPSGSGKTTALRLFDGLEEMFYRSDDVTPASFVSHDSSKSKEQLEEVDLLPRIRQKTLLSRDMAPWFAGDQEAVYKRMSIMAPLMDGDGYTRDSGSHGQRGYEGDEYRFNFIGATTPLPPRAWRVMGTVGNRLVFHEKTGDSDTSSVVRDVIHGSNYKERVGRCRKVIQDFLRELWEETGGVESIEFSESPSAVVSSTLEYLTRLVQHARAPVEGDTPLREGAHRIAHTLFSIAKGHAVVYGRRRVILDDMVVCGRIALSTIPKERRDIVRALLNPDNEGKLTASEAEAVTGTSRPTTHRRMELLDTLGIATLVESGEDNRRTKSIEVVSSFGWPSKLDFPTL